MSFQGDVGGIGLADLLQSLARGREGVLSLLGKDGVRSTVGIQDGQLHLLPDADEDPEIWRHRARQAWVKEQDARIDSLRMVEIARAQRIETLYCLLDSEGVHFRFAPGPLPERSTESALSASEPGTERPGPRRDAVYVQPMSVEGLLLEYARLQDEAQSAGLESGTHTDTNDLVPIVLDGATPSRDLQKMFAECDGSSNLTEIADRLGTPARQTRIAAFAEIARGSLRAATHDELSGLAQHELGQGYAQRAAARLRAWCACAPCGAMPQMEAQIYEEAWQGGQLQAVITALPPREARIFLRRLDHGLATPQSALQHWTELARLHAGDRVALVRLVHWQSVASPDPNIPSSRDLIAMARKLLDAERRLAAGALLRIAGARAPESISARLEIGLSMIAAGLAREAGPWIVEAARALCDEGKHDEALPPLRALLEVDPTNREARRIVARTRARAVRRTLVKKNSLVTIAVLSALAVGGVVQFRSQRDFDRHMEEVTSRLADPAAALRALEENFAGDDSTRITELRRALTEKKRIAEAAVRSGWTDRYREAQVECTLGDQTVGLRRALELPEAPALGENDEPLPLVSDLFNGLAARIEGQIKDLGVAVLDTQAQVNTEEKLKRAIDELRAPLDLETLGAEAVEFRARLTEFGHRIDERAEARARDRAQRFQKENLAKQDILLAAARAHAQAGDYARALAAYQRLVDTDTTGKLAGLFAKEIRGVEAKSQAIQRARELALSGRHEDAHATLVHALDNPDEYLLPWRVQSFPAGARAHLKDGLERVTPFTFESTWNERIDMTFDLEGHEPRTLSVAHPGDQFLYFSRNSERAWPTRGRVEAPPVSVGDDHVVCDRSGNLARIARGGTIVWQKKLETLSGFGRAPVFLPKNPGNLLLLAEDGQVWVVDANGGAVDGPWSNGTPPILGPFVTEDGVSARFRDGTLAEWKTHALPDSTSADATATPASKASDEELAHGSSAGLAVMRRRTAAGTRLESPWTGLTVDIGDDVFRVRSPGIEEPRFTVRRAGDWVYVAWEPPHSLLPGGRLWVSDGAGLRSFVP